MKITVKILNEEKEVLNKELTEGTYTFGRGSTCDFALDDQAISRKHVELRVSDAAVYLTNLSTTAKVYVKGKAVETAQLENGDDFTVGPYRITILVGTQPEASVPTPMEEADPEAQNEAGEDAIQAQAAASEDPFANGFEESPPQDFADPQGFNPIEDPLAQAPDEEEGETNEGDLDMPEMGSASMPAPAPSDASHASSGGETQVFSKPVVAKLVFEKGPNSGQELFVETYEVTFGRSKRADIHIDDEKLSRVHAKITRVGMGYRLVDLNSRNGTYVNGIRVLEHPLNSFDVVTLGNTSFKFLIHDLMMHEGSKLGGDQTRSVMMTPSKKMQLVNLQKGGAAPPKFTAPKSLAGKWKNAPKRTKMLVGLLGVLALVFFLIPDNKKAPQTPATPVQAQKKVTPAKKKVAKKTKAKKKVALPPSMPQEYFELSTAQQRTLEGHYQSAIRAAKREKYKDAKFFMKKVHNVVPYYKNSRRLASRYNAKLKAQQIKLAEAKARRDQKNDIKIYLDEGLSFLKRGKFARAAESFNSAIALDPKNNTALKGLEAAEAKVRRLSDLKPKKDPNVDKVIKLFQRAVAAFANKSYSEAIETAEAIRKIKLKDTKYLSEAKQIIDRARMLQKEEFEPFLIQAKEKYAEADYNASRDLCEEMVKRDPAYGDAKECLKKAKRQLNRLAKEAYVHGYILESMNKIDEAKQYWLRAKNYVRKGDKYYDKVHKKLEYYQ